MRLLITPHIRRLIDLALDEDNLGGDVASSIFFEGAHASARLIAKQDMICCGLDVVAAVFERVDPQVRWERLFEDGDMVTRGQVIGRLSGDAQRLLQGERTALNFLQRMSGVATMTAAYVAALGNPAIRLADTRKTAPGFRELDKYAVRCGGGANHRFDLAAGLMLKDNHIVAAGSIERAVQLARQHAPHTLRIQVEVSSLDEVSQAMAAGAEIIMLDNMSDAMMVEAIALIRGEARGAQVIIEASGNVTLERLPALGSLVGLDVISTGAITHSIQAADISMRFETQEA